MKLSCALSTNSEKLAEFVTRLNDFKNCFYLDISMIIAVNF